MDACTSKIWRGGSGGLGVPHNILGESEALGRESAHGANPEGTHASSVVVHLSRFEHPALPPPIY